MFIIEYFLKNTRLNYVLLLFLAVMGINAYIQIPKEMFPDLTLNEITVRGSYGGSSTTTLEKMAVRDIEDGLSSIDGIKETETTIVPGSFSISITLSDSADPVDTLNNVKDAIATVSRNLPSDMNEPTASIRVRSRSLVRIAVSSDSRSFGELIAVADAMKNRIAKMEGIAEVSVTGDSDEEVRISINTKALEAMNLSPEGVTTAIRAMSYTFPVGQIEQTGHFVFVSTVSGKADATEWADAMIRVGEKYVRLGDIAEIKVFYPRETTLATYNGKPTLTIDVSKDPDGDAITMAQKVREYVGKAAPGYEGVDFDFFYDSSKRVEARLDTIISNLFLGLILVFLTMYYLINFRTALVVTMGVPFAFMIGLLFLYYQGSTINLVSLLGALIVIGIVVDDAIVVSENIQRHLDEGLEKHEAVIAGVREMLLPVTLATLTTVIAFMPMLSLSYEIGRFIMLIPVVVIMVLVGSLIESFFFLPLHARELFTQKSRSRDWSRVNDWYEKTLHRFIHHKKLSLTLFLLIIPTLTFVTFQSMNFQFFPRFDGDFIYVSGKLDNSTPIEETYVTSGEVAQAIMAHKENLYIKAVSVSTGSRRNLLGERESGENLFYITLELHERIEQNWINRYLNPILSFSFEFNDPDKIRDPNSLTLAREVRKILGPMKERFGLEELGVTSDRPGLLRADIKVNLVGENDRELEAAVSGLQQRLESIDGVKDVGNNIRYGKEEYKLKLNSYGEMLGLSETGVAQALSRYFLGNRQAMTYNKDGVAEITTRSMYKDDIASFKNFNVPLPDGRYVKLADVVDITVLRDYEKLEKVDGEIIKTVYANVNPKVITASQVIRSLRPFFSELEDRGIGIRLKGEQEKNQQFKTEMIFAVGVALFAILLVLLFIFPKLKYALMVMSVIPLSVLGGLVGHLLMDINLTMPSVIGMLGLAGVVINDGIIMLDFLHGTHDAKTFFYRAKLRLRPIVITTVTTFAGLATLMFYATGQAVILQPLALSLGFGLLWGTVLNLLYLPTLYAVINKIPPEKEPHDQQETA